MNVRISEDNFYLPKCIETNQNLQIYDYSISNPIGRVQARGFYRNSNLRYSLINETINENLFNVDRWTGEIYFRSNRKNLSNSILVVRAADRHGFVDCFVHIQWIYRHELTPKFLQTSIYDLDFIEIHSEFFQFQVAAIFDHKFYEKNLEIRYRIVRKNDHFMINPRTGCIATKTKLNRNEIHQFDVEKLPKKVFF